MTMHSPILRRAEAIQFEKTAARTLLGDNPSNWPTELLGSLYRQHPFMSDFMVDLQIKNQDEALGYLYGVFVVKPPLGQPQAQQYASTIQPPIITVRVPVVVSSRKVYPFDIFITQDGKFLPLTQQRVTAAMFSATPHRTVSPATASSPLLVGNGFNPDLPISGLGKTAGLRTREVRNLGSRTLLRTALRDAPDAAKSAFVEKVASTGYLRTALQTSPAFADAVNCVVETPGKVKEAALTQVLPLVTDATIAVALAKNASAYDAVIATATGRPGVFDFHHTQLGNHLAGEFPVAVRQEAVASGVGLMSDTDTVLEEIASVTNRDLQKVATATEHCRVYVGRQEGGAVDQFAVLTKVAHLSGKLSNFSLVVGAAGVSLQDAPVGMPTELSVDLEKLAFADPEGDGFFIMGDTVSEPLRITSRISALDGVTLHAQDWLGRNCILKVASVSQPVQYADNAYLLPETARFVSMNAAPREYVQDARALTKMAALQDNMSAITVRANAAGGIEAFDVKEKIASYETAAESLLYLAALGDTPKGAKQKFAALCSGKASKYVMRPKARVVKKATITKLASATIVFTAKEAELLTHDLVKEAAALAAPDTVDAVLSLSFVTPETANAYLEHMPVLEDAISSLAEMVLGARMGVPEVPESAAAAALAGMDKAVQGLKMLQIRLSLPDAGE